MRVTCAVLCLEGHGVRHVALQYCSIAVRRPPCYVYKHRTVILVPSRVINTSTRIAPLLNRGPVGCGLWAGYEVYSDARYYGQYPRYCWYSGILVRIPYSYVVLVYLVLLLYLVYNIALEQPFRFFDSWIFISAFEPSRCVREDGTAIVLSRPNKYRYKCQYSSLPGTAVPARRNTHRPAQKKSNSQESQPKILRKLSA